MYIKLLIILLTTITTQIQSMYPFSFPIYTGTYFYCPMPQPISREVCPSCRTYNEISYYFFNSGYCTRCYKKYPAETTQLTIISKWHYKLPIKKTLGGIKCALPKIREIGMHEDRLQKVIDKYYEAKLEIYLTKVLCKLVKEYSLSKDRVECNCYDHDWDHNCKRGSILRCDFVLKIGLGDFYNFCEEEEEKDKQEKFKEEQEQLRIEQEKKEKQRLIEIELFKDFLRLLEEEFKDDENKSQEKFDQKNNITNFDPIKEISELYK